MPELPEVETIRLQLSQLISGLKIKDIQIFQRKSFTGDEKLLIGANISGLRRFAKMLVMDTDKGLLLAVHLKMTGQLIYKKFKLQNSNNKKENLPNKYTRVIINFTDGSGLFFNDVRRFGWMRVVKKRDFEEIINKLGPDPTRINSGDFYKILKLSKKPIKLLLMDQEKLGGVGNIYVCEALFEAGLNPKIPANQLTEEASERLLVRLKKSLRKGIKWGGASDNNYLDAYGEQGEMQEHFLVYGREGEKCLNNCGSMVKKIRMGGRGTYFCSKCQK